MVTKRTMGMELGLVHAALGYTGTPTSLVLAVLTLFLCGLPVENALVQDV